MLGILKAKSLSEPEKVPQLHNQLLLNDLCIFQVKMRYAEDHVLKQKNLST